MKSRCRQSPGYVGVGGPDVPTVLPVVETVIQRTQLDLDRAMRHPSQKRTTSYTAWQHRAQFLIEGKNLLDVAGPILTLSDMKQKIGLSIIPHGAKLMHDVRWDLFAIATMAVPPTPYGRR